MRLLVIIFVLCSYTISAQVISGAEKVRLVKGDTVFQATVSSLVSAGMVYPGAGIPNSTGSAWGTSSTGTSGNVAFWNGTGTLGSDASLFWDNSTKRLGIGTTGPEAKLHVSGGYIKQSGDHVGYGQALSLTNTGTSGNTWNFGEIWEAGKLNIRNVGGAGNPTVMTLTSTGNVGIGTTGPGTKLHVTDNSNYLVGTIESSNTVGGFLRFTKTSGTSRSWDIGALGSANGSGDNKFGIYDNGGTPGYRLLIDNTGNVGIGTTAPRRKTDILDASNPQLRLTNVDNTIATDINVNSSSNTVFTPLQNSTSAFNFTNAAGTSILNVDATNGFVGIGTTAPTSSQGIVLQLGTENLGQNPKLKIAGYHNLGNLYISQGAQTGEMGISINTHGRISNTDYAIPDYSNVSNWSMVMSGAATSGIDWFKIRRAPATAGVPAFVDFLTILGTGNVGIGETTTPRRKTDILDASNPQLRLTNVDNTIATDINVNSSSNTVFTPLQNSTSAFNFTNAAGTSVLNVDATNGRVGIGTTGPVLKLDVKGNSADVVTVGGVTTVEQIALFRPSNDVGGIRFGSDTATGGSYIWSATSGASLNFGTRVAPNNNVGMTILSSGNVGINTTSPAQKLHVKGQVQIDTLTATPTRIIGADANGVLGQLTGTGLVTLSSNVPSVSFPSSGILGSTGSAWTTSSLASGGIPKIGAGGNTLSASLMTETATGIGVTTTVPSRKFDILDATTPQLRLTQTYDVVYTDFQTNVLGLEINNTYGNYYLAAKKSQLRISDAASSIKGDTLTISAGNSGSGTNLTGGHLILSSGNATGNVGSDIIFSTPTPGASGTGQRSATEKARITGDGDTKLTSYASAAKKDTTSTYQVVMKTDGTLKTDTREAYHAEMYGKVLSSGTANNVGVTTAETYYAVTDTLRLGEKYGFTVDTLTGTMTYIGDRSIKVLLIANYTVSSTETAGVVKVAAFKGGTIQNKSVFWTQLESTAHQKMLSQSCVLALNKNDTVQPKFTTSLGSQTIVLEHVNFSLTEIAH